MPPSSTSACQPAVRNQAADRFHPYAPLLLLIGESDDWTPAAPCRALAATVAARHEPMRIVTQSTDTGVWSQEIRHAGTGELRARNWLMASGKP